MGGRASATWRVTALLALALAMVAATVRAAERTVGDAAALKAAVASAAPGDTIIVRPGVYRVHLVVDRPLVLRGMKGAVLDGGGRGDVIRVRAPDVVLRDLTVRNSGISLTRMNAGIYVEQSASGVLIRGNDIDHDLFGIWLNGCQGARVVGNRVRGIQRLRIQDRGDGIHIWNVKHALIEGNEIWRARDGIYIYVSNYDTLRDNVMHDLRYGIHYMYSNHNQVIGNRSYRNRTGYALMSSDHLTVTGNRSEHDRHYGILMNYITYSDVDRNVVIGVKGQSIMGGAGKALFVYDSPYNRIHGNLFADSAIGIHLTAGSDHNRIYDNAFVHNRVQVKYVEYRPQEWSRRGRGNYWSDYLGWDLNGDGIGDVPYLPNDAVDRILWDYPLSRLLMNSPTLETLRWVQNQFPVLQPPGVQDSYPLMKSPYPRLKAG